MTLAATGRQHLGKISCAFGSKCRIFYCRHSPHKWRAGAFPQTVEDNTVGLSSSKKLAATLFLLISECLVQRLERVLDLMGRSTAKKIDEQPQRTTNDERQRNDERRTTNDERRTTNDCHSLTHSLTPTHSQPTSLTAHLTAQSHSLSQPLHFGSLSSSSLRRSFLRLLRFGDFGDFGDGLPVSGFQFCCFVGKRGAVQGHILSVGDGTVERGDVVQRHQIFHFQDSYYCTLGFIHAIKSIFALLMQFGQFI